MDGDGQDKEKAKKTFMQLMHLVFFLLSVFILSILSIPV
jgi:hypothetical protein